MQKISLLNPWLKFETFCTEIYRSATAPTKVNHININHLLKCLIYLCKKFHRNRINSLGIHKGYRQTDKYSFIYIKIKYKPL